MPAVSPPHDPTFEEKLEAVQEGDTPIEISAARAALRWRDFRVMWLGSLSSNVGTWMQNVVLGAFAWKLTGSPIFVGVIFFAQLGPAFLLSIVGGVLADAFDRRRIILLAQTEQLVASIVLTFVALADRPNKVVLVATVLAVGAGSAINTPSWAAMVPSLVPREHLSGALSLNATQINGSRVIGPVIGSLLYHELGAPAVFAVNAATYLFAIAAVLAVAPRPRPQPPATEGVQGLRRIAEGFRIARSDPVVRWILLTITAMSFLSLPFLGQFPTIAADALGIDPKSTSYGLLYTTFGVGAALGGLSIGTFLGGHNRFLIARYSILTIALMVGALSVLSSPVLAYPVAGMLGFGYFAMTTSLLTILQESLADDVRGRILALWQTGWAGTVPLGNLVAGPIAQWTSIRVVLLYGAVAGLLVFWYSARQPFR
jgi:MFS family permease